MMSLVSRAQRCSSLTVICVRHILSATDDVAVRIQSQLGDRLHWLSVLKKKYIRKKEEDMNI